MSRYEAHPRRVKLGCFLISSFFQWTCQLSRNERRIALNLNLNFRWRLKDVERDGKATTSLRLRHLPAGSGACAARRRRETARTGGELSNYVRGEVCNQFLSRKYADLVLGSNALWQTHCQEGTQRAWQEKERVCRKRIQKVRESSNMGLRL